MTPIRERTMGRITEAGHRWQDVRIEHARCTELLTRDCLAAALSEDVQSCEVWRANWRNRIYRVTLADGTLAVAKQACVEQDSELAFEFSSLRRLAALNVPRLHVPQPIAYLAPLQAYLMEMAPGEPLDGLLRQGRARELVRACGLAGEVLAEVHNGWTSSHRPLPVETLAADLFSIPFQLTRRHREAIGAALQLLSEQTVPTGQPYLDFKPSNVLYDGRRIALIDPPEEEVEDEPLAWDLAVFTVSLDHELWKQIPRRSWWGARRAVRAGVTQFERRYRHHLAGPRIPPREFRLLNLIMCVERVGQLIALQKSKLQAGCRRPIPLTTLQSRLLGTMAEAVPLPLLKAHARYLFAQIARTTASDLARV